MNVIDITAKQRERNTPIRFAAYCRVSSDSDDQLHSFAAQIRYYKGYEYQHPNHTLVDIYADEGLTGTSMEKRDEMHRLIQDCKREKIDRIITKSVSRFARNTPELLTLLRLLKELGVSVYFEEQDIDTDKLNMEMIVTFPGMIAQQESESISGNMRWSYKKRMESGEFNCCTPAFGYDLVDGELIVNESEACVIRMIYEMYLSGVGKQNIARCLNAQGIRGRYGKEKWHHNTITYILNNVRYIGDALLQKSYTTETLPFRRYKNNGVLPQYYVENSHPSIISKEEFEAAQSLQKIRRSESYKPKKVYPLTRMMRCPECGRTFRRQVVTGVASWLCSAQATGETDCESRRIKESAVYSAVSVLVYTLQT